MVSMLFGAGLFRIDYVERTNRGTKCRVVCAVHV